MTDEPKYDSKKKAIAVAYSPDDSAPKVVATGKGYIADKILQAGRDNKIPIVKNPELVKELENVNLGEHIPPELYEAVARILVFITDIDKRHDAFGYGK